MRQDMLKMENLTETFANAFGNWSHLIQFHQISQNTLLAQSMLQSRQTPALCAQAAEPVNRSFIP